MSAAMTAFLAAALVLVSNDCSFSMSLSQPERSLVPVEKKLWSVPWPEYKPVNWSLMPGKAGRPYVDPEIGAPGFHPKFNQQDGLVNRRSHTGVYVITPDGFPLCPSGRTGASHRHRLGRWGPNHAADPIVTRWLTSKEDFSGHKVLSVVLIKRRDNGKWALPGGMVDGNEDTKDTASREFLEEATDILQASPEDRAVMEHRLRPLFQNGVRIWDGVVTGDQRNSDNSWMESAGYHFHDETHVLDSTDLKAGDDAVDVRWYEVNKDLEKILTDAHWTMIGLAAKRLKVTGL